MQYKPAQRVSCLCRRSFQRMASVRAMTVHTLPLCKQQSETNPWTKQTYGSKNSTEFLQGQKQQAKTRAARVTDSSPSATPRFAPRRIPSPAQASCRAPSWERRSPPSRKRARLREGRRRRNRRCESSADDLRDIGGVSRFIKMPPSVGFVRSARAGGSSRFNVALGDIRLDLRDDDR